MTAETTELHLNLLLDIGKPQEALAIGSNWIHREPNYETIAHFADLFNFKSSRFWLCALLSRMTKQQIRIQVCYLKFVQLYIANGNLTQRSTV